MKTLYLLIAFTMIGFTTLVPLSISAQKTNTASRTPLTNAEKAFVQDAINKNNDAVALAQTAIQHSQKKEVQTIARQFLSDHRAAQKKLYAIANLTDTIPYSKSAMQPIAGTGKLPATDNLDSRRNRTVVSITDNNTKPAINTTTTTDNNATGNTVAGSSSSQQRIPGFDTSSRFGTNQTFNGNTAIDNANGVNNSNRTDLASASGRVSENNATIVGQGQIANNQQANSQQTNNTTTNINNTTAITTSTNDLPNTPNFPNRATDTVRQTGSTIGFQNPGTNLSFPANERYSKNTPAVAPNNNAGSDYGVPNVVVNNAQTNSLNTAPYANNDINSNSVQTGRVLPTSNPASVINSSTASMGNKDVGFNNANTNRGGNVQQSGQLAADNANGVNRRTSKVINTPGNANSNTVTGVTTNNNTVNKTTNGNNGGAILAGRARNNRAGTITNQGNSQAANGTTTDGSNTGFYTQPFVTNQAVISLRNTPSDAFDAQWVIQMNNNQQAAVTAYQAALRRTVNIQLKSYINTVLPLLRGHQFALKQWQAAQ